MALAVVIILLVAGSLLFHFLSPWWFTPIASNWGTIDTTVNITFWVTGIVFIAINGFMAYAIIRYRHKKDSRAHYEPENKKLEGWLVGLTSIGVIAMLAPGLFVWAEFVEVPEDAAEVEVVGQQWRWMFRYPGEDGVFGTTEIRNVNIDNPFGLNPKDPRGRDDVLVDGTELHLPVNVPVKILLRSKDVLHNFTVPQFRVKMDMVPGMVTYLWVEPTRTGEFEILCEELCGIGHFAMRNRVVVNEQDDFSAWLANQETYGKILARGAADPAKGRAMYAVCASCHGQQGEGNPAVNAPKLSGLDPWYIEQQLKHFKSGMRGAHENDAYGRQMAAMAATLPDDDAIRNVAAYIGTFADEPADVTISGNTDNGRRLYLTCGNCHGREGEGKWAVNAPRLSGVNDWYLVRQLENFKDGIRGTHTTDASGRQMAIVSNMLSDNQAIHDVVAYINSL